MQGSRGVRATRLAPLGSRTRPQERARGGSACHSTAAVRRTFILLAVLVLPLLLIVHSSQRDGAVAAPPLAPLLPPEKGVPRMEAFSAVNWSAYAPRAWDAMASSPPGIPPMESQSRVLHHQGNWRRHARRRIASLPPVTLYSGHADRFVRIDSRGHALVSPNPTLSRYAPAMPRALIPDPTKVRACASALLRPMPNFHGRMTAGSRCCVLCRT